MPPQVTAQALLGIALLLALGFHRNRAAQLLALLLVAATGVASGDPRAVDGSLRFIPGLLLAATILPEPRLISRRNGVMVLVTLVLVALTMYAPEHVLQGLLDASAWLTFNQPAPRAAALVTLLAALLCLLRWAFTARPMECGLALVLLAAALAFAQGDGSKTQSWGFAAAGGVAVLAVLYASYRMAFVDGLSGLPNRRALDETLMRLTGHYALAMTDIDHFKQFNDNYGHAAGDVVLRLVARTLRRHGGGRAFRYGGEEFCLVFEGSRVAKSEAACEAARAAVQALRITIPAALQKGKREAGKSLEVAVTISIGVAARTAERRGPADVLKAADQALYKAKAKGRNRVIPA
jgi:diguanylate cyclase (GGDEF)-like protein